jgi:hypothetical protein
MKQQVRNDLFIEKYPVVTLTAYENDNWSKLGMIKADLELTHDDLEFQQTERIFASGVKSRRFYIRVKGNKKP